MIYQNLLKQFNNSSDLLHKQINDIHIVYLESLCSGEKINEQILKTITLKPYIPLRENISGPSVVYIDSLDKVAFYLLNGFAFIYNSTEYIVCEVKADLYRGISAPTAETSINGPKDSFNENIVLNLGLIKRRIKSEKLAQEDYFIGKYTDNKVSMLYIKDLAKNDNVKLVKQRLKTIKKDIIEIEMLSQMINDDSNPMPTIMKSERPDVAASALLEGKIVIIADNSPYCLILPAFFADFINPIGDRYVKSINVNFLKILRMLCLIITIILPAFYLAIINYNQETIPLKLLLSLQVARSGVPFASYIEALVMFLLSSILRESDIRFPSSYGSSISILGALVLGEAAVAANIVSPIMIIIVSITFITALVFNNSDLIDAIRYYRFFLIILAAFLGLYGIELGIFIILIKLCSTTTLKSTYLYPISPFDKTYFFKTILKAPRDKKSKILTKEAK